MPRVICCHKPVIRVNKNPKVNVHKAKIKRKFIESSTDFDDDQEWRNIVKEYKELGEYKRSLEE